ncbi:OsmC family protein [Pseudonocardia sichuanensis]
MDDTVGNEKRDAATDAGTLKERQAPLKARYREDPQAAVVTLTADGELDGTGVACRVRTATALAEAGLHPATGGDGTQLCSGDMLLEALVACAGVTLRAVATSLGLSVAGTVHAEGDLDFRGTLGVDKEAPVGFRDIRLTFDLDTAASEEEIATLVKLTERYCVVLQTLVSSPTTSVRVRGPQAAA